MKKGVQIIICTSSLLDALVPSFIKDDPFDCCKILVVLRTSYEYYYYILRTTYIYVVYILL